MVYFGQRILMLTSSANTWPNWVDLIVVILVLLMGYNGFGRGFLAELLNLAGAVSVTALTMNYSTLMTGWLFQWLPGHPMAAGVLGFWTFFLIVWYLVRLGLKYATTAIKWERVHWILQGCGFVLGGLRGLWWSGFILLAMTSSGFVYLHESIVSQSVLGPRVVELAGQGMRQVADRFPGARRRGEALIPPIKQAPKSP